MEKKKLKLENVEVQSFITKVETADKETIKGEKGDSWLISDCFFTLNCPTYQIKTGVCCFSRQRQGCNQESMSQVMPELNCPNTNCCGIPASAYCPV